MFDIGWSEMAMIAVIALIVIGPRDLPRVLYSLGRWVGKARGLLRDLQQGMEDIAREAELEDMKKNFDKAKNFDVRREIGGAIDPDGQIAAALDPTRSRSDIPHTSPELEEDESHGASELSTGATVRSPVAPEPADESSEERPSGQPGRPAGSS